MSESPQLQIRYPVSSFSAYRISSSIRVVDSVIRFATSPLLYYLRLTKEPSNCWCILQRGVPHCRYILQLQGVPVSSVVRGLGVGHRRLVPQL
jgi:hypothetical protein